MPPDMWTRTLLLMAKQGCSSVSTQTWCNIVTNVPSATLRIVMN